VLAYAPHLPLEGHAKLGRALSSARASRRRDVGAVAPPRFTTKFACTGLTWARPTVKPFKPAASIEAAGESPGGFLKMEPADRSFGWTRDDDEGGLWPSRRAAPFSSVCDSRIEEVRTSTPTLAVRVARAHTEPRCCDRRTRKPHDRTCAGRRRGAAQPRRRTSPISPCLVPASWIARRRPAPGCPSATAGGQPRSSRGAVRRG